MEYTNKCAIEGVEYLEDGFRATLVNLERGKGALPIILTVRAVPSQAIPKLNTLGSAYPKIALSLPRSPEDEVSVEIPSHITLNDKRLDTFFHRLLEGKKQVSFADELSGDKVAFEKAAGKGFSVAFEAKDSQPGDHYSVESTKTPVADVARLQVALGEAQQSKATNILKRFKKDCSASTKNAERAKI